MKKIVLSFILCASLFGAAPFTLENLQKLRIIIINNTDFIDKQQEFTINKLAEEKLKLLGIALNQVDSGTLMLKIESKKIENTHAVSIQIAVAEEVNTKRQDKIGTLAFTYFASDLIDTKEPYTDTLESINFLLEGFSELYLEDKD